ncbi:uncharacterized protein KD926_005347 [Aspergillus affinis]|uniref:uncharacterized protein n=1 Tax=Aspergillus affinis TaxID=1070780 RepID=UPI0022FE16FF|nr:uncharacterized protein KD926_005347 [Aspergillus affinis]KAI9034820.1 hypothetical protein KD926_005347 [Aspergillus affinis]
MHPPASPILQSQLPRDSSILQNMANAEPTRASARDTPTDEEDEILDPDLEDGDQVIARHWPRNHENHEKHGFRPVYISNRGYPSPDIPADIEELLNLDRTSRAKVIVWPREITKYDYIIALLSRLDRTDYSI